MRIGALRHARLQCGGRRRDIVELYSGHMHHLREQVNGVPEPETRRLYERLVEGRLNRVLVER